MTVFLKILGYILGIGGLVSICFNGTPKHWEKGTWLKHILIDVCSAIVMCAGLALISGRL